MSDDSRDTHWLECVAELFSEHDIAATKEQIVAFARDASRIGETEYLSVGPAGYPPDESIALRKELAKERDKITCRECNGTGVLSGPVGNSHWYRSACWKCNGHGRHAP